MFSVYKQDIYGSYDKPYGELVYMTNDINSVARYLKNLGINNGFRYKNMFRSIKLIDGGITIDNTYYDVIKQ